MMILSQYHIFELDTINIYSVTYRHKTLHCYKTGRLIPPAWSDDAILNVRVNGGGFRYLWRRNPAKNITSNAYIQQYRTFPLVKHSHYRIIPMIADVSVGFSFSISGTSGDNGIFRRYDWWFPKNNGFFHLLTCSLPFTKSTFSDVTGQNRFHYWTSST
jgi:hypothetical protein